jgi:Zn-dependent protease with chaperone function
MVIGCSAPVGEQTEALNASPALDCNRAAVAFNRINAIAKLPARIVVDPTDRPAAWSWADGTVCVSRGFVERTSDDELSAVVAHELGHLCMARDGISASTRFGFRGEGSISVEHQADVIGVRLLKAGGLSSAALIRALRVVRDGPQTTPAVRDALNLRINLLREND